MCLPNVKTDGLLSTQGTHRVLISSAKRSIFHTSHIVSKMVLQIILRVQQGSTYCIWLLYLNSRLVYRSYLYLFLSFLKDSFLLFIYHVTHPLDVCISVALTSFVIMCSCHHSPFCHPKKKSLDGHGGVYLQSHHSGG
jgi:hypothetical protein